MTLQESLRGLQGCRQGDREKVSKSSPKPKQKAKPTAKKQVMKKPAKGKDFKGEDKSKSWKETKDLEK